VGKPRTIHYFVWLRALGAVAIVLLHTFVTLHIAGGDSLSSVRVQIEDVLLVVLSRWAVPVFFMMSGALMLDPEREMGWDKTLRHVWRLGFVLLTFGFAFCIIEEAIQQGGILSVSVILTAFVNLLNENSWDHMWFIYQLLGFYLMTPIIRPWLAQASRRELGVVSLTTCLLFFVCRFASKFLHFIVYYGVYLPQCFAYYLAGYYIHRYLKFDWRWAVAGAISLTVTVFGLAVLGWEWAGEPMRGLIAPYSVAVMLAAKRYLDKPVEGHRLIALLADFSFGIYIIHPLFQHLLVRVVDIVTWPAVVADLAMTVVSLVLSIAFIWLLRFVPGFRGKV